MLRSLTVSAAAIALATAPAAIANDDVGSEGVVKAVVTSDEVIPVKLVEFNGEFEVLKASRRLRIWRSHVAYKIDVDAEGNATDCEVTEKFRRAYVNKTLCSVLMKHHTFEPAHDASGTPVEGSYAARLSYTEMRERN